jgi:CheY-like chemotaxis protein
MATVLVAADNADLRALITVRLEARGHLVLPAAGGIAALDVLHGMRPDVALLDLRTPDEIRRYIALAQVPIILVADAAPPAELARLIAAIHPPRTGPAPVNRGWLRA